MIVLSPLQPLHTGREVLGEMKDDWICHLLKAGAAEVSLNRDFSRQDIVTRRLTSS
jgi:hypothetical protein